jgi:CDP-glucose 4,6-dehydratase
VTTDKCYRNNEWPWGYRETDALGGHDAYSASKAATELAVDSYRQAFYPDAGPLVATARAGNVIGGGDFSEDRLIPDLVRATMNATPLRIRNPKSTRPWQHVLDSLAGYLVLGGKLLEGRREFAEPWNFGPDAQHAISVEEVLRKMSRHWPGLSYELAPDAQLHEAGQLRLDSAKSRHRLAFEPVWDLDQTLAMTATWYRAFLKNGAVESRDQLEAYGQAAGL